MVRGKNWVQALVYAALSACIVAAPAASAQRTTDVFARGTALSEVAQALADEFPGLSQAQVSRLIVAANPGVFDGNNRLRARDALLLPRADVGRQVVGLAPLPPTSAVETADSRPALIVDETAPRNAPVVAASAEQLGAAKQAVAQASAAKQAGDIERAYRILNDQLDVLGGDPEYDYALGISALDAGYYSQASFALQRVLFAQPNFAGARLDLARAQIALGDFEAAREELDRVEASEPPMRVSQVVNVLRTQIDNQRVAEAGLGLRGRIALLGGYDSNANAATSDSQIVLGGIPIILSDQSRKIDSPVYGADASLGYARRLGSLATLSTSLGLTHRQYADADFVDATTAFGQFGQTFNWNRWSANVGVAGSYTVLDDRFNNRSVRSDIGLAHQFDAGRLGLTLRSGLVRYADRVSIQDVNQRLGSLAFARSLGTRTAISISGLVGKDTAQEAGSPYGRSLHGARLRVLANPADGFEASFNAGYVASEFDGPFLGQQRDDDQLSAGLILTFRRLLWDSLDLGASVRHVDNESTATLFDYTRNTVGLTLAKEF